jgi:hypothetical protein
MLPLLMIAPSGKEKSLPPRQHDGHADDDSFGGHVALGQSERGDMNAMTLFHKDTQTDLKPRTAGRGRLAKAQVAGAAIGLGGSVTAGLSGALLTLASWLVADQGVRHWLSTAGTVLLLLTIPLIILAAYCLDWMEKDKPQRWSKVARYDDEDDEF